MKGRKVMICEIEYRLKEIIVSSGEDIKFSDINENTDLIGDYNFTSINFIQLIVKIENVFDINIRYFRIYRACFDHNIHYPCIC